jgi:hypothetical protein
MFLFDAFLNMRYTGFIIWLIPPQDLLKTITLKDFKINLIIYQKTYPLVGIFQLFSNAVFVLFLLLHKVEAPVFIDVLYKWVWLWSFVC